MVIAAPRRTYVYREKSDNTKNLDHAFAKAQGKFLVPKKNRTAQYGNYADLLALLQATTEALTSNGLSIRQEYHSLEGELYLVTVLSHESGEWVTSTLPIKQAALPQHTTAYMTYMRRAAYSAICCLSADDEDDGESANVAATASAGESSKALERRAAAAITTAANKDAMELLLKRVEVRVENADMTRDALDRLRVLSVAVLARLAKGAT